MVFVCERYTGFKDKRSFLVFLKQFLKAVLEDELTLLSDASEVLRYYLDPECQLFYDSYIKKRKTLEFICTRFANVFSPGKESNEKVSELLSWFNETVKEKEINSARSSLSSKKKEIISPKKSLLLINTVPPTRQQQPSTLSSISNQRKSIFVNVAPVINKKEMAEVGPSLRKRATQNYFVIKKQLLKDELFKDPEFPADNNSLFFSSKKQSLKKIEWLRPPRIVKRPHFFCDGYSRFDVVQGQLGNCWFLAALSNLTLHPQAFYKVVNPNQSFSHDYAGIFHFKFWQYGKWSDIVIDDRLPTFKGKLIYLKSSNKNEFWSALLEKAYAKLYGSYEALEGGLTSEALEDMTGGLTEVVDIKNPPKNLLNMIFRGIKMGSFFGCSSSEFGQPSLGLINRHAYSITGAQIVKDSEGHPIPIIRIRNPWGDKKEWKGLWSDKSSKWINISLKTKQTIKFKCKNDGEFWMSFEDFQSYFKTLDVCHIDSNAMQKVHHQPLSEFQDDIWSVQTFHGAWRFGENAGGSRKYVQRFHRNPQYFITIDDSNPEDDNDLCTLIIGVLQKYRRELKHENIAQLSMKFSIFKTETDIERKLNKEFFENTEPFFESQPAFDYLREVTSRILVPPGKYILVPSTQKPNEEANFMLRIFTDGIIEAKELE